jgi:hypothetical protein
MLLRFTPNMNGRYRLLAVATDGLTSHNSRLELNPSRDGVVSSVIEVNLSKSRRKNFIARHPVGFVFMAVFVAPIAIIVACVTFAHHSGE